MPYASRYGADTGGGFHEVVALDPQTVDQYAGGGDTWGLRYSSDGGNRWIGSMSGWATVSTAPHGRTAFFSKRVATAGLRFYGVGPNGSGGGLYYCLPGSLTPHLIDSTNNFGLGLSGAGVNATARRPCGQLIDSWVSGTDTEYIFTVTLTGLHRYANTSNASGIAAKAAAIGSPTNLLTTANIGTGARLFVEVIDDTHLVVINWDHTLDVAMTPQPTDVYLVRTSASDWSGATTGNTTATLLTIDPPAGRVYEIHRGKNGVIYAAAGYDGVWTVALNGPGTDLVWTKISASFFDELVVTVDATTAGVVYAGQAGSDGSYGNSSTGMPTGHSVGKRTGGTWSWPASGSAVKLTEFKVGDGATPTGRTWWLSSKNVVLSQSAHDCAVLRVDPFDDSKVVVAGRAGQWQTRDAGASWGPSVNGLNGGVVSAAGSTVRSTGTTNVTVDNVDYGAAISNDRMLTCSTGTFPSGATGGTVISGTTSFTGGDGHAYVFTPSSASAPAHNGTPATLTRDAVPIHDAEFQGAIVAPSAILVLANGTVIVSQDGGGAYVLEEVPALTAALYDAGLYDADTYGSLVGEPFTMVPDGVDTSAVGSPFFSLVGLMIPDGVDTSAAGTPILTRAAESIIMVPNGVDTSAIGAIRLSVHGLGGRTHAFAIWTGQTVRPASFDAFIRPVRFFETLFVREDRSVSLTLVAYGPFTENEIPEALLIRVLRPLRAGGTTPLELFDQTPPFSASVSIDPPGGGSVVTRDAEILNPAALPTDYPLDFDDPEEGWLRITWLDGDFTEDGLYQVQVTLDDGEVRLKSVDVWRPEVNVGPASDVV